MSTTSERTRLGMPPIGASNWDVIDGVWRLPGQRMAVKVGSIRGGDLHPVRHGVLSAPERGRLVIALCDHRSEHSATAVEQFGVPGEYAEQPWPLGLPGTGSLVLGEVEQSGSGNSVLRFGRRLKNGGGWEQTHHVVLPPAERDTLIALITTPNTQPEELEAAAALLHAQAEHLEAVARAWPAHNPHTSTSTAAKERREALIAARTALHEGLKGGMVEADPEKVC